MSDLPEGFINKVEPTSKEQTIGLYSNDKIKTLTKLKLQEYIESFFKKDGVNRSLLKTISPRSISYNIEKSFSQDMDPTQKKMQIARYAAELRNILPAILIVDSGVIPIDHNIGQISDAYIEKDNWFGSFPIFRQLPMSVVVAAMDVDSADEMASVISLLFNELRNLAGGHYIHGDQTKDEKWVITLPNSGVPVDALSNADVPNDPVTKIWYSEAALEVYFQDTLSVQSKMPTFHERGAKANTPNLAESFLPVIQAPDTVPINQTTPVNIVYLQDHHRVQVSNPNIFTISRQDPNSRILTLTPRLWGSAKILVQDTRDQYKTLTEHEVKVI